MQKPLGDIGAHPSFPGNSVKARLIGREGVEFRAYLWEDNREVRA